MESLFAISFDLVKQYAEWLVIISVLAFFASLLLMPVFVARIPVDYFCHSHRERIDQPYRHPLLRIFILILKNLIGAVLLLAGFIMLFTPGQGVITLFAGLMIMNYPGKYALERWLIRRPHVLPAVNWLRQRAQHPPLVVPPDC